MDKRVSRETYYAIYETNIMFRSTVFFKNVGIYK